MRRYQDQPTPRSGASSLHSHSSSLSLFRPRASDTGSIFREEVWPPPTGDTRFVDPFMGGVRRSRDVDLGSIVDDVMGPSGAHRQDASNASTSSDPFRSVANSPASSLAQLPPGASAPAPPGSQVLVPAPIPPVPRAQHSRTPSPPGFLVGTATPKKPSPLARALSATTSSSGPSSQESTSAVGHGGGAGASKRLSTGLWLDRKVGGGGREPTG